MRFLLHLAGATAAAAAAAYIPGKAFDRFITIWLENQDFTKVDKDSGILDLTKQGILLTEYYGLTHPSQPNYIASVGGDYFGLNHDGFVRIPQNVSTLVDLLDSKNIDWRGYFEGLPGPGYMGEGSTAFDSSGWDYVRKHNPFVSYDSINLNGTRLAKLQSFDDFAHDVKANTLPQYMHLSPDMLNDGHNTSLAYATNWTTSFLAPLLANPQFMERTLILLTYDESETYAIPNRIVSLLLGGAVPKNLQGTQDDTLYTHYSILSTLENNWDLPTLGRYDVGANVFSLVALQTGYTNNPSADLSIVNNSLSYSGFLNKFPAKYLPLPAPNLQLIGAGGQGVDVSVLNAWRNSASEQTPYDGSGELYDGGNGTSDPNKPVYAAQGARKNFTATATGSAASATHINASVKLRSDGYGMLTALLGLGICFVLI